MTTLRADSSKNVDSSGARRVRIVVRDESGTIHFDWPVDRLREVLDQSKAIVWVDLQDNGLNNSHNSELILRDVFGFHSLAIEDAVCESHVPRVDDWGEYLYIVFHSIDFDPENVRIRLHELDVFLGRNYVVTYHTETLSALEQLRKNIERDPTNRLRHGADHLVYHILDICVAEYLPAIEHMDEAIDAAQNEVFEHASKSTLQTIFRIKRSTLRLHRILAPEREVLNRLARDDYDVIHPECRVYFRDVYDHIVRVHDIMESLRDLISSALDTYLSAISNRTNDIMKALTLVTVMFLPISFLTSFFGMNFFGDTLTFETRLPKALLFFTSCLIMTVTPIAMAFWARWKGWF
jgi:magnesium transporter